MPRSRPRTVCSPCSRTIRTHAACAWASSVQGRRHAARGRGEEPDRGLPIHSLSLSLCAAVPAFGAAADEIIGQRLKVSGTWDGTTLLATRMQERDADKDPRSGQIEGAIASVDADGRSMRIGPLHRELGRGDDLRGDQRAGLGSGVALEVSGSCASPCSSGDLGGGWIGRSAGERRRDHRRGAGRRDRQRQRGRRDPRRPREAAARERRALDLLTVRGDDRRPEEQLTVELFDLLVVGGELGVVSRYETTSRSTARSASYAETWRPRSSCSIPSPRTPRRSPR